MSSRAKVVKKNLYIQSYRPSKDSSDFSNLLVSGNNHRIMASYGMLTNVVQPNILILINISMKYENHLNERVLEALNQSSINSGYITLHLFIKDYDPENPNYVIVDISLALNKILDMHKKYKNVVLAGYNLSTWFVQQIVMRRPEVTHYILISPSVKLLDYSFSHPSLASGLVIQPDRDTINLEKNTREYVNKLKKCKNQDVEIEYMVIRDSDHFFRMNDSLKKLDIIFSFYLRRNINTSIDDTVV